MYSYEKTNVDEEKLRLAIVELIKLDPETSDWWSKEKYLSDMWFFVYKEHRKSNIAAKLIKSFMKVAKNSEFKVKLGHVYSGDGDRKDKFYERLGLSKVGSLYTEA